MSKTGFAAGWAGGALGILASHPLDVVRVRVQVSHGSPSPVFKMLVNMFKQEGLFSLYRGLLSPVITVGFWKAAIFASSDKILSMLNHADISNPSLWSLAVAGFCGGAVGNLIQCPMEVIKCKTQINRTPVRLRDEYTIAKSVVRAHGAGGLFRGLPLLYINSPWSYAVWFPLNEYLCKKCGSEEDVGFGRTLACAAISGCVAWIVAYPGDKLKTIWIISECKSYHACFAHRFQSEGIRTVLYGGLWASQLRAIPQCAFTMWGYKEVKRVLEDSSRDR